MKRLNKIPAFTLTEMLVVLAISTIVVGLAFTIISLFSRNIQLIQNNYSSSTKLSLLEDQLTIDFNRFHVISYNDATGQLSLKNPIDSIVYSFDESIILRGLDTVLKTKNNKKIYLSGNEVKNGWIDAIKIAINKREKENHLFIYKENDAYQYITNYGN